jgi:hypothetical protein
VVGVAKYFKKAFLNRWNLLALSGGTGAAIVAGAALFPVLMPLVLAGEIAVIAMLATHPKFQAYIDAQEAAQNRQANSQTSAQALQQILRQLPRKQLDRFEQLRSRCLELRQIASDLKQSNRDEPNAPLESFQLAGLDRLLWIFLRLQFTQFSIARFLERTSIDQIQADIKQTEYRLSKVPAENDSPHNQKIRRTLEDNLQTCKDRLANYEKAKNNYELVGLELDRLENKIRTLAELAVNRQEPDFISGQVDQVAGSMLETEKTMNELQFATGLGSFDEEAPQLVQEKQVHYIQ